MTTLITDEPAGSILLPTYDQSTERRLAPRPSLTDTVQQTLAMAWRALKKMRRNPEQFFERDADGAELIAKLFAEHYINPMHEGLTHID